MHAGVRGIHRENQKENPKQVTVDDVICILHMKVGWDLERR